MTRQACLTQVSQYLASACRHQAGPLKVGIDGVDAAGKTTLRDEIAALLLTMGLDVIGTSIDHFHNPREIRYQMGKDSPEGYYKHSFNYSQVLQCIFEPLASGHNEIQLQAFDYRIDQSVQGEKRRLKSDSILLMDGIFLQRPELVNCWDRVIFVAVAFDITLKRNKQRACAETGTDAGVEAGFLTRYMPGQQLYLQAVGPRERADIVWENSHLQAPKLTFQHRTV